MIIEQGEDGYYIGTVPELKDCHSQSKSLDGLIKNGREAMQLCLEVEGEPEETLKLISIHRVEV